MIACSNFCILNFHVDVEASRYIIYCFLTNHSKTLWLEMGPVISEFLCARSPGILTGYSVSGSLWVTGLPETLIVGALLGLY